jgi:hypothetical protein
MIQNLVRNLGGIGIFGTVSICLFVVVFGGALLWACRLRKPFLNKMGALPLQDDAETPDAKGAFHHE